MWTYQCGLYFTFFMTSIAWVAKMSTYLNAKYFLQLSVVDFCLNKWGLRDRRHAESRNGNRAWARQEINRQNANLIFSSFWRHNSCQATHTHTNSYSLCDFLLAQLSLLYVVIGDWAKCLAKWKLSLRNIEEICVRTDWMCLKCQAEPT